MPSPSPQHSRREQKDDVSSSSYKATRLGSRHLLSNRASSLVCAYLPYHTYSYLLIPTHNPLAMDSATVYSYSYTTEVEQPIDQETSGGGSGSYCVIA
ncbi:hypothetical protein RHS01_04424 [Rhizoctonia solani]|nr:hypothetical protein RHS01_04424 [Rhizoctonia solani]